MTDRLQARAGRLLVAAPGMVDPNFAHTVVLLAEHDDDGSVGVVLNRPSEVPVLSLLAHLGPLAAPPPVVFAGGPVQRDGVLGLGRCRAATSLAARPLAPGIGALDLDAEPGLLEREVTELRLFAGYAGWSPGQLDEELAAGGWFLVEATPDDVFAAAPAELWVGVLRRQGGLFATVPPDPSQN